MCTHHVATFTTKPHCFDLTSRPNSTLSRITDCTSAISMSSALSRATSTPVFHHSSMFVHERFCGETVALAQNRVHAFFSRVVHRNAMQFTRRAHATHAASFHVALPLRQTDCCRCSVHVICIHSALNDFLQELFSICTLCNTKTRDGHDSHVVQWPADVLSCVKMLRS